RLSALRVIASAAAAFLAYLLLMGTTLWVIQRFWLMVDLPAWLSPDKPAKPATPDKSDEPGSHLVAATALVALVGVVSLGAGSWMTRQAGPAALWYLLIGNALVLFGTLTSRFTVDGLDVTGKPLSKGVIVES